eukprot:scaffold101513_cov33-Phaeocystis_antarctica.AAC.1
MAPEMEPRRSPTWEIACGDLPWEAEQEAQQQQQQDDNDNDASDGDGDGDGDEAVDEDAVEDAVERRHDGDEGEFTCAEFVSFYGAEEGRAAWRAARPAAAHPAAARSAVAPGCGTAARRGTAETALEVTALRWAARRERGVGGE